MVDVPLPPLDRPFWLRGGLIATAIRILRLTALLLTVFCVPAHADTYYSGSLTNGETIGLFYSGGTPTFMSLDITAGPSSLPGNCNFVTGMGCNSVAVYQWQATLNGSGGVFFFHPIITTAYCNDADSCIPLSSPSVNSPSEIGEILSSTFSLTASINGGCGVEGNGPNVGFAQASCDGFSLPTFINFSIDIKDGGNLTETPLPAALPLFAAGLCAFGFFGRRSKRKAQLVA